MVAQDLFQEILETVLSHLNEDAGTYNAQDESPFGKCSTGMTFVATSLHVYESFVTGICKC